MGLQDFLGGATKHMEGKVDGVKRKFRSELRSKSDEEVRSVIRNGNSIAREIAREEADRRGIRY